MSTKQNKKRGVRSLGLKRDSEGNYYNPSNSLMEFKRKKNGDVEMIVPNWLKKEHQQKLRTLKYYGDKYGISNKTEIQKEKDLYKNYTEYVKKWNKGEISKISTVGYRFDLYKNNYKATSKFYRPENKTKIIQYASDSFKVKTMRIMGKHGIYNGKAYDDYLNDLAESLGEDKDQIEKLIFPTGLDEKSTYETIYEVTDKGLNSIDRLIDIKVAFEDLDEVDEFAIRRKLL